MLEEEGYVPRVVNPGVVAVEAELVPGLLYPSVQAPVVPPEGHAEYVVLLKGVARQLVRRIIDEFDV